MVNNIKILDEFKDIPGQNTRTSARTYMSIPLFHSDPPLVNG